MPLTTRNPDGAPFVAALDYNPETGVFTWKEPALGRRVGKPAGHPEASTGYRRIMVGYRRALAHRLAWFFVHGRWPDRFIDHINGNRDDNRIANLRPSNESQNQANQRLRRANKSGFKGVHFEAGRYRADIRIDGQKKYLGRFDTAEEAHAAYCAAASAVHGEYARAA